MTSLWLIVESVWLRLVMEVQRLDMTSIGDFHYFTLSSLVLSSVIWLIQTNSTKVTSNSSCLTDTKTCYAHVNIRSSCSTMRRDSVTASAFIKLGRKRMREPSLVAVFYEPSRSSAQHLDWTLTHRPAGLLACLHSDHDVRRWSPPPSISNFSTPRCWRDMIGDKNIIVHHPNFRSRLSQPSHSHPSSSGKPCFNLNWQGFERSDFLSFNQWQWTNRYRVGTIMIMQQAQGFGVVVK